LSTEWVVLIVGLVTIATGGVLMWRAQSRGDNVAANFSIADMFSVQLQLTTKETVEAEEAVHTADSVRGFHKSDDRTLVESMNTVLARILWVDDYPDNNLYETVALQKLGKLITATTDTRAALAYLDNMDFDLVITDIGRQDRPRAGIELIDTLRDQGFDKPIVVYTQNAEFWRDKALSAGADAVLDTPGELVRSVVSRLDTRLR
jgi:CheY-like chemotaxis protein